MTAKYVWNSVFVFAVAVAIFCTLSRLPLFFVLFLSLFLLPINIFESKSIRKDITFILMSIPVTFTRLCKRIPEEKANKKEKTERTSERRNFAQRFRYFLLLDISIGSGWRTHFFLPHATDTFSDKFLDWIK